MHLFYDHVNNILQENVKNILIKNLEDKEKIKSLKNPDLEKLQSFYATDIFRSLFNVVELLSGDIKGQLLYEIIKIVVDKLKDVQRDNDQNLLDLCESSELICSCIYTLDAQNCLEILPDFKKKIKNLLQKEFYERIKIYFSNTMTLFNNSIKIGSLKSIELMFIEIENNYLKKIFTEEWNSEVLTGIFETFRVYFNKGFSKILKIPNILLIVVRSFIDSFTNYYIEELIHSIRSLNRKKLAADSELFRYNLRLLKLSPDVLKYISNDPKDIANTKAYGNIPPSVNIDKSVKVLDKYIPGKKSEEIKFKKYEFPVKKFTKEGKECNPAIVYKKINEDCKTFSKFLESFKEDAKEPFSKNFQQTLGQNYINTYLNKLNCILDVLKCSQDTLVDTIQMLFKESFSGDDGKVLLESLLYIREDHKSVTKPEFKKFYLNRYDK